MLQLYQETPNEIGVEIYWLSTNTQRKKICLGEELKLTKLKKKQISKQINPQQQNKRKEKKETGRKLIRKTHTVHP